MFKSIKSEAKNIFMKDPACKNLFIAMFFYPSTKAMFYYRIANKLYKKKDIIYLGLYLKELEE